MGETHKRVVSCCVGARQGGAEMELSTSAFVGPSVRALRRVVPCAAAHLAQLLGEAHLADHHARHTGHLHLRQGLRCWRQQAGAASGLDAHTRDMPGRAGASLGHSTAGAKAVGVRWVGVGGVGGRGAHAHDGMHGRGRAQVSPAGSRPMRQW